MITEELCCCLDERSVTYELDRQIYQQETRQVWLLTKHWAAEFFSVLEKRTVLCFLANPLESVHMNHSRTRRGTVSDLLHIEPSTLESVVHGCWGGRILSASDFRNSAAPCRK